MQKPPEKDYQVGYKRPPKHTQFKKGMSGNKQGRRKKAVLQHPRDILREVLSEPVRNGSNMTHLAAIFFSLRARALSGDTAATRKLVDLALKTGVLPKEEPAPLIRLIPPDVRKEILDTLAKSGGTTLNPYDLLARD